MSARHPAHQSPSLSSISFMTANYVAREVGFSMTGGWGQGDSATNAYFSPLETFRPRFSALLAQIASMGFTQLDLWMPHLHWAWATTEHIAIARDFLAQHNLRVVSLAGSFGTAPADLEAACKLARALDTTILGGTTPLLAKDRATTLAILKEHGVRLAIENHPAEKTAHDMLVQIGDGADGTLGTALDTGWYATNSYDPVRAIEELFPFIIHVHLKDILAPGAHDTCRYGLGCVDIPTCVATLKRLGYHGIYSIEHEPADFDPSQDCQAMLSMLQDWVAS